MIGNRPEREDSPAVLSEGHGCIGKLVTTLFNMLQRAGGATAHAVIYNCLEGAGKTQDWTEQGGRGRPNGRNQGLRAGGSGGAMKEAGTHRSET